MAPPFLILIFSVIISQSNALLTPHQLLCNKTPFPLICSSTLSNSPPVTPQDYSRFALKQSLQDATQSLSTIQQFLQQPSTSYLTTIHTFQDCHTLISLTIDYLTQAITITNSTNTLDGHQVHDLETLLSAVVTNGVTCLDGLKSLNHLSELTTTILESLREIGDRNRVTLGLFKVGEWGRNGIGRRLIGKYLNVKVKKTVVVTTDGTGDFTSINDAISSAPNNTDITDGYYQIYITSGVYEEYVSVPKYKKYIMMVGDGINQTIITGNRSVVDGWTTFNSATFIVVGQGFVGINMTIRNTAGAIKNQAVAVRNGADMSTFYNCSFQGYQDTLYTHSLRQFYRQCDIYGTIDFIFGNAATVLQNCNLYPLIPLQNQFNVITAQGRTDINQNTGISIHNCTIKPGNESTSYGSVKTYLGRPWKEYSRTVYMESYIDSLVDPGGWTEWSGDFALSTLYYAEYNNRGPGSNTSGRVSWSVVINVTDAVNFTVSNFTGGDSWLPPTGVPYSGGLFGY